MELPKLIKKRLKKDDELQSIVHSAISTCNGLITNNPPFFPAYTDHSLDHCSQVLNSALGLLTKRAKSKRNLTAKDYAVLTLAVLLHDCGMHLTPGGFQALFRDRSKCRFDDKSWPDLWQDFLVEARRWDGRQLINIFGDDEPLGDLADDIPDGCNLLQPRRRLLIGEFLRRHHPRLAHEIALFGFPDEQGEPIWIVREENKEIADLAGFIARSHGISLRSAVDSLFSNKPSARTYQKTHPTLLMGALRLADYLQIQPERAPNSTMRLRQIESPFSEGEWRLHQAVKDINSEIDDPEALHIEAQPEDVEVFLKFRLWIEGFQAEIDATWAVIGEVYGRFDKLAFAAAPFKLRRLRSNTDDREAFGETVDYVPRQIRFETAGAELLSLLIKPLYGDRPEIGLRELIQNSVDAVLEREHLEGKRPTELLEGHDTDILIYPEVEGDRVTKVVVMDRGIGMDEHIIQKYFLRAGASFRRSQVWREAFEDSEGANKIARSGRFGVGALATFLIGNSFSVETKRLNAREGYVFDASLKMSDIHLKKTSKLSVGTRITINVDPIIQGMMYQFFRNKEMQRKWDWYIKNEPKILRMDVKKKIIVREEFSTESADWICVKIDNNCKVKIKREEEEVYHHIYVAINGIVIGVDAIKHSHSHFHNTKVSIIGDHDAWSIVADDKNGIFETSVTRFYLESIEKKSLNKIKEAICKEYIAGYIAFNAESMVRRIQDWHGEVLSFYSNDYNILKINWEKKLISFPLISPVFRNSTTIVVDEKLFPYLSNCLKLPISNNIDIFVTELNTVLPEYKIESLIRLDIFRKKYNDRDAKFLFVCQEEAFIMMKAKIRDGMTHMPPSVTKAIMKNSRIHDRFRMCGDLDNGQKIWKELLKFIPREDAGGILFVVLEGEIDYESDAGWPLRMAWDRYIGDVEVPARFEDREAAFPMAFEEFGDRIAYHRERFLAVLANSEKS